MFIPLNHDLYAKRYQQALSWAFTHRYACVLSTHGEAYPYGPFPNLMAVEAADVYFGTEAIFSPPNGKFWVGAISYDYGCRHLGHTQMDDAGFAFFAPQHLIQWLPDGVEIESPDGDRIWKQICQMEITEETLGTPSRQKGQGQTEYEGAVKTILNHLHNGEAYEVNYCRYEEAQFRHPPDLSHLYKRLTERSPMPFQYGYQSPQLSMVGSSPERFLRKMGSTLVSQPIKGTARRGSSAEEDAQLRNSLHQEEKILAENMMITDLVQNDLVQICAPGTVRVEELFGIYTFERLHQLITTIAGTVKQEITWSEILAAAFPMGSMTGAPKKRALEIIAETEPSPRGYFSGAFGYILPDGDFDFSVIIRTLFLEGNKVIYRAGGAIVWDSIPKEEWAEADLKMEGMRHAIGVDNAPI